jgi:hypothetical protein
MQPELLEALAGEVVLLIKAALGPVLERLAVAEAGLARTRSAEQALDALRDRVLVGETKAAQPAAPVEAPIDLTPLRERLAAIDAQLQRLPAHEQSLGDLRDRVVSVETKAAQPGPLPDATPPVDLGPVVARLAALELRLEMKAAETSPILGAIADLTKDVGTMRERLAVVEVRPSVPGPKGDPGPAGTNGLDGTHGAAGLSFEGVYQDGKSYAVGHLVTWAGSSWHCNEATTTKPGDGSKAWTLMVKRGRDGKDGLDAPGALPVVSVGGKRP